MNKPIQNPTIVVTFVDAQVTTKQILNNIPPESRGYPSFTHLELDSLHPNNPKVSP